MTRLVAAIAVALSSVVLVTGCAAPAPPVDPKEEVLASGLSLSGLSVEDAEARVRDADADHERRLWTASGLDDELGGTAAADAAFADLQRWGADRAAGATDAIFVPASSRDPGAALAGFGGAWWSGYLADFAAIGSGIIGSTDGKTGTQTTTGPGTTTTTTATETTVSVTSDSIYTEGGVSFTMRGTHEFDPCPDPEGVVTVESRQDIEGGAGSSRLWMSVVVTTVLRADDDAGLASKDYSFDGGTGYDGPEGHTGFRFAWGTVGGATGWDVEGDAGDDAASSAALVLSLAAGLVAMNLESIVPAGWQQPGRCVDLQVASSAGPTGLDPGATVTLDAEPRAKRDGAKAGGTVTAELRGPTSLDPNGTKVKADATFTYVAPDTKGKATVDFQSRSKRGVGAAAMTLSVGGGAYTITGGQNDFQGSTVACDLAQPFSISSAGITQTYTPSSESGGTWTQSGTAGGADWSGGGSYTIALAADGSSGTLTGSGTSTISTSLGAFSDSVETVFALTPTTC